MKTASQVNNPQQQPQVQAQHQVPQPQSQVQQPVNQVTVPTPTPLDVDTIIQKLTNELTHLSITDVLNSPVLAAAAANPELIKLINKVIDCNKTVKQQATEAVAKNMKEEASLPTRYGALVGMFNLR